MTNARGHDLKELDQDISYIPGTGAPSGHQVTWEPGVMCVELDTDLQKILPIIDL